MRLILVRHGESEGNAAGVLQGRLDYGLSRLGHRQAELTAERLAAMHLDRVSSSPLLRAAATAAQIATASGLDVELDHRLAEYDIGEAAGLTPAELRAKFTGIAEARTTGRRFMFPGEEGRDVFQARLRDALDFFQKLEGTTVAVAHGGVISALCQMVVGLDLNRPGIFQVGNCSLTEMVSDRAGRLALTRQNDTCHLAGLETFADRG